MIDPILYKGLREIAQGRTSRVRKSVLTTLQEDGYVTVLHDKRLNATRAIITAKGSRALSKETSHEDY